MHKRLNLCQIRRHAWKRNDNGQRFIWDPRSRHSEERFANNFVKPTIPRRIAAELSSIQMNTRRRSEPTAYSLVIN